MANKLLNIEEVISKVLKDGCNNEKIGEFLVVTGSSGLGTISMEQV